MFHRNWYEKASEKNWEELQKYKEFDKNNFKSVDKFSSIFNKIFNFFRFSFLSICIIAILIAALIYILYVADLKNTFVSNQEFIRYVKMPQKQEQIIH